MTLYKFPSGRITSDEDYKKAFVEEYPPDRPESKPDYIPVLKENKQAVFNENEEEDDD